MAPTTNAFAGYLAGRVFVAYSTRKRVQQRADTADDEPNVHHGGAELAYGDVLVPPSIGDEGGRNQVRPLRFVALSEDGQALILTDEVGRMLSLAIDEVVIAAVSREQNGTQGQFAIEVEASLTPRDIQARIRAGDTPEEVARVANVSIEKVLRFAGPVLQERAAIAQLARRTRLRTADNGASLGDIADKRLVDHGIEVQAVAWDAYRREDGGWRVTASWPSGKATAHALWDLDKARTVVTPIDDMAHFLSTDREPNLLAHDEPPQRVPPRIASSQTTTQQRPAQQKPPQRFTEEDSEREGPMVPSLSVLRRRDDRRDERRENQREDRRREEPRRTERPHDDGVANGFNRSVRSDEPRPDHDPLPPDFEPIEYTDDPEPAHKERRAELPSWDDILFGARHKPGAH